MKNAKITILNSIEINSPFSSLESGAKTEIETGEGLSARFSKPLGVKFMGMTVATVSSIKTDLSGEVKSLEMEAPFLVKTQVENEIKKAAKNIPVSRLEDFLDYVKACDNAEIELNICEDGSVKVSSNSDLSVGTPRRNLRNFTILKSGEIEGGFGSLNSEAWQKFQSFLA
ncbi:MAG: hypothetical protein J6R08_03250 [Opitutales bacterium]|nr:hypothetical protein [Opitutales bacterium]